MKQKKNFWQRTNAIKRFIFKKDSSLYVMGWMESLKRGYPCRPNGQPIPWMNFSIVSLLESRLNKNMTLFEFGSGYSTLFYAQRVKEVTSVEHGQYWYEIIKSLSPDNVTIMFQENDRNGLYCRAIAKNEKKYNVVIIDGRDRVNCIKQAITSVSDDGVIILDNAERDRYLNGISYAKDNGFRCLEFQGIVPASRKFNISAVFYRSNNCFNI